MSDTVETATPPSPAAGKKARGRPVKSAPETPQQRIDRLKAELRQAEQAKRELEERRDAIVGKIVVAHALANPDYRRQLGELLKREVKSKGDLEAVAELLG